MRASGHAYLAAAESHALVVVAAEGLAVDEGERGDDEDDAGRCRSDARGQPSTAFVAAERVGGTVDSDGADITREREKKFRERPLLHLLEMEGAFSFALRNFTQTSRNFTKLHNFTRLHRNFTTTSQQLHELHKTSQS